ncbi:hypothetical protein GQ457_12G019730 [Hibiscus cannabinus]
MQTMNTLSSRKRKALTSHNEVETSSLAKRREILEAVNKGIIQISPGNWVDVGFGAMMSGQVAFFPKAFTESSPFINSVEFKKRG